MSNNVIFFEHKKYNNCLDDTLCYLLDYDGIPNQYIYLYCWHLQYARRGKLGDIGKYIDVGWGNPWKALQNNVGYEFITYPSYRREEFTKCVKELSLEKRPLILNCDSYNAEWTRNYHKYHTQHFCVLVECNKEKIKIVDPLMSEKCEETSLTSLLECPCKVISSELKEIRVEKRENLVHFLTPNLLGKGEKEYKSSLKCLIEDLKELNINKNTISSATLVQLENHKDSIMNLAKLIEFTGSKNFEKELGLIEEIGNSWKNYIKNVLSRVSYSEQECLLNHIISCEECLTNNVNDK